MTRIRLALATATYFLTCHVEAVVPWHIMVPRKASKFIRSNVFSAVISFTDRLIATQLGKMENLQRWRSSNKAYRTQLMKLHRTVTEIMNSNETPNEPQLESLSTSIEKLQQKAKTIVELDTIIAGELPYPEELERDIFEAVELQDDILERIDQTTCFISHHVNPDEPLLLSRISTHSSSLSATAQLFVPPNVEPNPLQNLSSVSSSGSHGSMVSQTSQCRSSS